MGNSKRYLVCCLVVPLLLIFTTLMIRHVSADQYFDRYDDIPWQEERAHLANFAVFLREHPEMIGYIASCSIDKGSKKKAQNRLRRAKKYLTSEFKLPIERIRIVIGQKCVGNMTILQPLDKSAPPLTFF